MEKSKRTSSTPSCKHSKYLSSIIHNLVTTCDEVIKPKKPVQAKSTSNKTVPTNLNEKK